ncbi:hypothetical protein COI_2195 [Mannheimia haemolytica serotype A2 str. OVINE]|nr:hypothetical protein COI_2195 [Mannheimia haemolytica serotype A2 str. OVINE]
MFGSGFNWRTSGRFLLKSCKLLTKNDRLLSMMCDGVD